MSQNAAVAHRLDLIRNRTEQITEAEATITPDAALIVSLYALRLAHIVEALDMGVEAATLAEITGNGN